MAKPNIVGSVFVAGDVFFGENVTLFHGASIRGDWSTISIGDNSNIQDNATVHCDENLPTTIGKCVTVGHNAIVHSAQIGDNCVIGMGAILLNGCVIGENCIIGAGTLIGQRKVIPNGSVVVGNPYRILKECSEDDIKGITKNALEYVELGKKYTQNIKKEL
ncbi:MAG: gamma carbonic anhydrase family protein [Clostridia bacterium]